MINFLFLINQSNPHVIEYSTVEFCSNSIKMVKPRFNPITRVTSSKRQSIVIPDRYSVNLQKSNRPLNTPTRKIIDNFYHLNYEATQKPKDRKSIQTRDQATNTDPPPPPPTIAIEPEMTKPISRKANSSLFIRVKRSFLKKLIGRVQWQTKKLDLVRDYLHR